jgi:hypothetical protein
MEKGPAFSRALQPHRFWQAEALRSFRMALSWSDSGDIVRNFYNKLATPVQHISINGNSPIQRSRFLSAALFIRAGQRSQGLKCVDLWAFSVQLKAERLSNT